LFEQLTQGENMKLRACAVLLAALGLSTPVFAQSSTAGKAGSQDIGASGVNETTGTSNPKNIKAQGSGSGGADIGTQPRSRGASGTAGASGTSRSATGATGGTAGSNVGATGVNETNAGSSNAGVKPQGSGSGGADIGSGPNRGTGGTGGTGGSGGSARSGTGGTGGTAGSNIGATGTNETAGSSHPQGVKPEGSGSGDSGKRSGGAPRY
jgi:hypothetical protein